MSDPNIVQSFNRDDIKAMEQRQRANFINSLSGFKSANLVGTQSSQGLANLALFSSVFHLGADPALMGMIVRPHTVPRDTLENLMETGYFTINHVYKNIVAQAHQCSARYPAEVDEFQVVGLSPEYLDGFCAPFVAESQVKIGLRLEQVLPIALNQTQMVIGAIEHVILHGETLHEDGYVDIEKSGSVAISGLDGYHETQSIGRFAYAKVGQLPRKL